MKKTISRAVLLVALGLFIALPAGIAHADRRTGLAQPTSGSVVVEVKIVPSIRMTLSSPAGRASDPSQGVISVDSNAHYELTADAGATGATYTAVQD